MSSKFNLTLQQSADFLAAWQISDANNIAVDLSSMTIESQMRHDYTSTNVTCQFICNGFSNGYLSISLPASNTVSVNAGSYVYDIMMKDSFNNTARVIEGLIKVTPDVTQFV